ncbi:MULTISPECIES: YbaB/EbfC family nucleoid-associated protein [Lactobacillaceae]|uniref:YbaB/EbfC family nucleoid-associated protein n=1 Tax=Lactobacillaceae TaxID=33958 RepID=UPI000C1B7C82|nr:MULTISPECIES: YbaB/EbfC family nucleoid-associated protein [Lactobacillaceae]
MAKMPNMGGMGNMANMMKQAQKMQKQMMDAQEQMKNAEYTGSSSQDLVVAKVNGEHKLLDLKIDPKIIDPEDPDLLQDMIVDAVGNAINKALKEQESALGQYTNGLF